VLEELDAVGYASSWIAQARAPLLELVDRGTYLDAADVAGFLDLSLPGVDEVAAVLRLAELADEGARRVVVDTAPTGHTLRLLEAPAVLKGWAAAFDAMEEKAAAVISGLMRRPAQLAGRAVIRDLEERVARFRERVLVAGAAVLVERPGVLVEAQSRRLRAGLAERGLRVAARVLTPAGRGEPARVEAEDGPAGAATFAVPWREGLVGCAGIRLWGEGVDRAAAPPARAPGSKPARGAGAALIRDLDVDLLLFVGKGGVGKTTCSAAAAVGLAAERATVLLGTDPAGSLADVLGVPIPREGTRVGPLRVREIEARSDFADFRARYRADVEQAFQRLGVADGLALDRRVVSALLDLAPPGADELFAILALIEAAEAGAQRVVDAAPTGHLLRLLEMPELALDWTRQLMRVLVKYRAALGLDAFAERLLDFAKQLKDLNLRLHDPSRTAAVVVTLAGPLVAAETARLEQRLRAGGVRVAAVLLNRATESDGRMSVRGDAPRLHAPLTRPSPIGPSALADFFERWTVAP
jgi:arsenite-transporting ATPase